MIGATIARLSDRAAPTGYDATVTFGGVMPTFFYRCPTTGQRVQGFTAEEDLGDTYQSISCPACRRLHVVNPTTGKVRGKDDDDDDDE